MGKFADRILVWFVSITFLVDPYHTLLALQTSLISVTMTDESTIPLLFSFSTKLMVSGIKASSSRRSPRVIFPLALATRSVPSPCPLPTSFSVYFSSPQPSTIICHHHYFSTSNRKDSLYTRLERIIVPNLNPQLTRSTAIITPTHTTTPEKKRVAFFSSDKEGS